MHYHINDRRDAAGMAAVGLVSWLLILPLLCVALVRLVAGDIEGCKEMLVTVGMSLSAPFIYGWLAIAGPPQKSMNDELTSEYVVQVYTDHEDECAAIWAEGDDDRTMRDAVLIFLRRHPEFDPRK